MPAVCIYVLIIRIKIVIFITALIVWSI